MRIIAGKYKRTNLKTLDSLDTRPTKDMVREALFSSILINEDDSFLDLFAGSGAIGIEAISRGARKVVFNDINKKACEIIKENLEHINENSKIFNLPYEECLLKNSDLNFNYIFLDPPYSFNEYENALNLIDINHVLNKEGIIIVEVKKDTVINEVVGNFKRYKERKYGISKLLYYKR